MAPWVKRDIRSREEAVLLHHDHHGDIDVDVVEGIHLGTQDCSDNGCKCDCQEICTLMTCFFSLSARDNGLENSKPDGLWRETLQH